MSTDQATSRVLSMLARAAEETPPFPPAELVSEGWMLRLVMDTHTSGGGGLPIARDPSADWYSEARMRASRAAFPHNVG